MQSPDGRIIRWAVFTASFLSLTLAPTLRAGQTSEGPNFQSFQVILRVTDIRRSVDFYRTVLEFKLETYTVGAARTVTELATTDRPYGADLSFGEQRLVLQDGLEMGSPLVGVRLLVRVADADAYAARIRAHGVPVTVLAADTSGRVFWFRVSDPDGHEFEFSQAR